MNHWHLIRVALLVLGALLLRPVVVAKCDPTRILTLTAVGLDTASDSDFSFDTGEDSATAGDSGDTAFDEWEFWPETIYLYGVDPADYGIGSDGVSLTLAPNEDSSVASRLAEGR